MQKHGKMREQNSMIHSKTPETGLKSMIGSRCMDSRVAGRSSILYHSTPHPIPLKTIPGPLQMTVLSFFSTQSLKTFLDRCYERYFEIIGGLLCFFGSLPFQIGISLKPRWYRTCEAWFKKTRRLSGVLFVWLRSSWCTIFQPKRLKYFETSFLASLSPWRYLMSGEMLRLSQA